MQPTVRRTAGAPHGWTPAFCPSSPALANVSPSQPGSVAHAPGCSSSSQPANKQPVPGCRSPSLWVFLCPAVSHAWCSIPLLLLLPRLHEAGNLPQHPDLQGWGALPCKILSRHDHPLKRSPSRTVGQEAQSPSPSGHKPLSQVFFVPERGSLDLQDPNTPAGTMTLWGPWRALIPPELAGTILVLPPPISSFFAGVSRSQSG